MGNVIQSQYTRYQAEGWPGMNARPRVPCKTMLLKTYTANNGRKPRPGDAVMYDSTQNAVKVPTSDAEVRQVVGIVSYDVGTVQQSLDSTPSGANSNQYVEYASGSHALIYTFGVIYGIAAGAAEYGDLMRFNRTSNRWETYTETAVPATAVDADVDIATNVSQTGSLVAAAKTAIDTEINTKVNAALAALKAQLTGYLNSVHPVTITCDDDVAVAAGGLVKLNIGVRG